MASSSAIRSMRASSSSSRRSPRSAPRGAPRRARGVGDAPVVVGLELTATAGGRGERRGRSARDDPALSRSGRAPRLGSPRGQAGPRLHAPRRRRAPGAAARPRRRAVRAPRLRRALDGGDRPRGGHQQGAPLLLLPQQAGLLRGHAAPEGRRARGAAPRPTPRCRRPSSSPAASTPSSAGWRTTPAPTPSSCAARRPCPRCARWSTRCASDTAQRILAGIAGADAPPPRATAVRGWLWFMDGAILDWIERRAVTAPGCTGSCSARSRALSASRSSLSRVPNLLSRLAVDVTPLRESRDLRLLVLGNVVSGLGTQAALVALPYQVYVETRLGVPDRPARRGRAGPAHRDGPARRRAGRPPRPAAAAAARPDRRSSLIAAALAALTFAGSRRSRCCTCSAALLAGLRRDPERHALGDRPEPRRARRCCARRSR